MFADSGVLPRLVAGLGRKDDGGDGGVRRVGDILRRTGIRGDPNVLDECGKADERSDIGVGARDVSAMASS